MFVVVFVFLFFILTLICLKDGVGRCSMEPFSPECLRKKRSSIYIFYWYQVEIHLILIFKFHHCAFLLASLSLFHCCCQAAKENTSEETFRKSFFLTAIYKFMTTLWLNGCSGDGGRIACSTWFYTMIPM